MRQRIKKIFNEEKYKAIPAALYWVIRKIVFSRLFLSYINKYSKSVGKHTNGKSLIWE